MKQNNIIDADLKSVQDAVTNYARSYPVEQIKAEMPRILNWLTKTTKPVA